MGTDIHAFVEYASDDPHCGFSGDPSSPALLFGQFALSRDYSLFDALGDGRNSHFSESEIERHALVAPRGLPGDISHAVAREYYDLITDTDHPNAMFWPAHGCVSEAEAASRVAAGHSHYGTIEQDIHFGNGPSARSWRLVSKPYWHTASWLNAQEVDASLDHFGLTADDLSLGFSAMLVAMRSLADHLNLDHVRLVFWFDN